MDSLVSAATAAIPGALSNPGIPGLSPGTPVASSGAVPVTSAAAPLQPSQMTPIQQMMAGGFPMEKMTLILLTLFPATGLAGINLQALQNTTGALLKAGSYLVGCLYAIRLMNIYPGLMTKIISGLIFLGPWFVFDAMEILVNPDFSKQGFRPPMPIPSYPPPKPTDGSWLLTPALISIILALLPTYALGFTGILNSFMPGLVTGDTQKYMGYAVGGTAMLGAGFSMFAANKAPATVQAGGGPKKPEVPSLSTIVRTMKQSASPEAFDESKVFLGLLGVIITGGFALSMARNTVASAAAPTAVMA